MRNTCQHINAEMDANETDTDTEDAKTTRQTCTDVQQLNRLETNGKLGESFLSQLIKRQHLQAR